jgi:hypothetical protein
MKEEFREIIGFNGRYLIDLEGRIIDTTPYFYNEYRFLRTKYGKVGLMKEGKERTYLIVNLIKSAFPEVTISDVELNDIKQRVECQDSILYDIKTFNRFIFPNEIIKIFDKTWNKTHKKKMWKKPSPVTIRNGKILIKKNHIYFGWGTRGLIYIKSNCLPYNGKQFEETNPKAKEIMREKNEKKRKRKQKYFTELWDD